MAISGCTRFNGWIRHLLWHRDTTEQNTFSDHWGEVYFYFWQYGYCHTWQVFFHLQLSTLSPLFPSSSSLPKGAVQGGHPGLEGLLGGGVRWLGGGGRGAGEQRSQGQGRSLRLGRERDVLGRGLGRLLLPRVAQQWERGDPGQLLQHTGHLPGPTSRHHQVLPSGAQHGGGGW